MENEGRLLEPFSLLPFKRLAATKRLLCTDHFLLFTLLLFLTTVGCASQRPLQHADSALQPLAWLAGSWVRNSDRSLNEEYWSAPAGDTMIGVNRTVVRGKTVFYEYLRIEQQEDGIYYLAAPKGRFPPTAFKLMQLEERSVVFENPEHDFPTRIIYRRKGNTLHAHIEGHERGAPQSSEWTWQRVSSK